MKMQWKALFLAAAAIPQQVSAQYAQAAMMRFQCSRYVAMDNQVLKTPQKNIRPLRREQASR